MQYLLHSHITYLMVYTHITYVYSILYIAVYTAVDYIIIVYYTCYITLPVMRSNISNAKIPPNNICNIYKVLADFSLTICNVHIFLVFKSTASFNANSFVSDTPADISRRLSSKRCRPVMFCKHMYDTYKRKDV